MMINPLEGMKVLHKGKIHSPLSIIRFMGALRLLNSKTIPLLRFLDKDSTGNWCWSGDIVRANCMCSKYNLFLLFYDGYRWRLRNIITANGNYSKHHDKSPSGVKGLSDFTRVCHLYDEESKENFSDNCITKLKEMVCNG